MAFLMIFQKFPKILQNSSEGHANIAEHFPKISKDYRRFPGISEEFSKTFEEEHKMFRSNTNKFNFSLRDKLDISEIIDIFTSEDMVKYATRVPDVVSYEFYDWCIFQ